MDSILDTHERANCVFETFSPPALRDTSALLRTAIPSADEDRALTEANIAYAKTQGTLLDEEIAHVRQNLDKLEQKRSVAGKFEEMERGLLSPIRKLPMDVLRHIFQLANDGVFIMSNDFEAFGRTASQVCSYWRLVAHSCAPLWTDVMCVITPPLKTKAYLPKFAMLLEDSVKYSNSMPMTLHLGSGVTPELLGYSGVQALAGCARRWGSVHIAEADLAMFVFSLIPRDSTLDYLETLNILDLNDALFIPAVPKLRHLTVTCPQNNSDPRAYVRIQSAPCLVHLTLENFYLPSMSLEGFDWSWITHLEAEDMDFEPNELLTLLQRMPNLVSLTIHGETGAFGSVVMPHLEELKAGERDEVDTNIFDSLIAPRLRKLEMEWGADMLSLVHFVGRSGCKIEELKLTGLWINESWCDPAFSSVKTLIWEDPLSVREGIEKLVYGSAASPNDMFSGLENLQITDLNGSPTDGDDWSVTQLIDMLNSRLRPQQTDAATRSCLKSLRIDFLSLDDAFVVPLTNFVNSEFVGSSGVKVDISGRNLQLSSSK